MSKEILSTAPKPFVFVLMPFDEEFGDIYKYGIKGAAKDAGAYAERVDEQLYDEGILDRIFNQINKADIIVADMTGQNPNVFYEVGYADALGKIVLLLTKDVKDIPFDLKHRPHIVYDNINTLQSKLVEKLIWAMSESRRKGKQNLFERLVVSLPEIEIPEANSFNNVPIIPVGENKNFPIKVDHSNNYSNNYSIILKFSVRNRSPETISISFIYLFTNGRFASTNELESYFPPDGIDDFSSPEKLSKQFKLFHHLSTLSTEAADQIEVEIGFFEKGIIDELYKLRIHTSSGFHDFPFRIKTEI